MDIPPGVSGVAGGLISVALLGWLSARAARRGAEIVEGRLLLRYSAGIRLIGWLGLAFGLFILFAVGQSTTAESPWMKWGVGGGLFLACLSLLLEFLYVRISFDDEAIYTSSPWRKSRRIPWGALRGYDYSDTNRWHILKTEGFGTVRLSVLLSGLQTFHEAVLKQAEVEGIENWRHQGRPL